MSKDIVIGDTVYESVEAINVVTSDGNTEAYYNDAVRYVEQDLTVDQVNQVRKNIHTVGQYATGLVYTPYEVVETGLNTSEHTVTETPLDPVTASVGAEIYNDYEGNIATGYYAIATGYKTQATGNYSRSNGWWTRSTGQCSNAEGLLSVASGNFAHAEGTRTKSSQNNAHSEGDMTTASGRQSHAEGQETVASGFCSHAEGSGTKATSYYSHSEGLGTIAAGRNQTAMGKYNISDTTSLVIVGNGSSNNNRKNAYKLDASGNGYFAGKVTADGVPESDNDLISKKYAEDNFAKKSESGDIVIEGEIQAENVPHTVSEVTLITIPAATIQEAITNGIKSLTIDSFTWDTTTIVYAYYGGKEYTSIVNQEGYIEFFIANPYVTDGFACSFEMGGDTEGNVDPTKGVFNYRVLDTENVTDLVLEQLVVNTIDSKYFDHDFTAINSISMNRRGNIGTYSTSLGSACVASGNSSFAAGLACEATGAYSIALGKGNFATGEAGLAVGEMTTAGRNAIANGRQCQATGRGSLSTGNSNKATGVYSVAEGQSTQATNSYTHAEGLGSIAKGVGSHAEGNYTLASSEYQHVQGKYNVEDTAKTYAHIIGNGTSSARSNIHTVKWTGEGWFKGDVYVGSTSGTNKDDGSKKLATEEYVDIRVPAWTEADEGKILKIVNGTPTWVTQ